MAVGTLDKILGVKEHSKQNKPTTCMGLGLSMTISQVVMDNSDPIHVVGLICFECSFELKRYGHDTIQLLKNS